VDQIFDRFERLFRSWVSEDSSRIFGDETRPRYGRSSGDSDFDSAMSELDDFLDRGRTETEARERERARREREEAARRAAGSGTSSSSYARPSGPPQELVQAYRTLGLAYGTPFPEVKAAYKKLLMQNHPDRNSATPEQLKRSTEISAQINAAYHRIETWTTKGKLDDT
jgi:hypothetical protein